MAIGIYPTLSGAQGTSKFLSTDLVCDTTGLIRLVNVRSVKAARCAGKEIRILRGIISVGKDWTEWQWAGV